jgi:hypothetical protein
MLCVRRGKDRVGVERRHRGRGMPSDPEFVQLARRLFERHRRSEDHCRTSPTKAARSLVRLSGDPASAGRPQDGI